MRLFWTQCAVAGAFAGEAKAFVTSSPGTANSIDFPASSCTGPSTRSRRQCRSDRRAGTNPEANGCLPLLGPCIAETGNAWCCPRDGGLGTVLSNPGEAGTWELTWPTTSQGDCCLPLPASWKQAQRRQISPALSWDPSYSTPMPLAPKHPVSSWIHTDNTARIPAAKGAAGN